MHRKLKRKIKPWAASSMMLLMKWLPIMVGELLTVTYVAARFATIKGEMFNSNWVVCSL